MSRAVLLNKRRKKKKPILLPQNTYGEALGNQYNGNLDLLETTDAYKLNDGNTGTAGYIDSLMPPALEQSAPALKLMDEDEANSIFQNPNSTEDSILQAQKYVSGNFTDVPSLSNDKVMDEQTATGILQNPNADPVELNATREYFSGGALSDPVGSGRGDYGMPVPALDELSVTDTALLPAQEMPTGARKDPYMAIPSTKEAYHRMPDGTLMADSEMEADGVLNAKDEPKPKGKGVLNTDTTSSNDRKGSVVSGNARGSMMPFAKINRNEALMRIGGAMVGGSSQGFSGAMKAATDEFGNIQDANRQAETAAFNKEEATRLAEERIAALKAKGSAKDTNQNQETAGLIGDRISDFESGLQAIADSKAAGGNLTGVGGVFKSYFDNFTGDPDAARRLLLKRLQVNDTLLRTAETKGAISNYEMTLFKSPTPTNFMDEKIWSEWINARLNALRNQQYRLKNGIVLPESERSYRFTTRPSGTENTTTDNNAILDEADAIIGL